MRYYNLRWLVLLLSLFILLQSCADDETDLLGDETTEELRRGGRSGGDGRPPNDDGTNQGPQGQEVALLPNEIVVEWMALFLELDRYAEGMRPNATARAIAYINLAAYETAVPGMTEFMSNSGMIPGFNINTQRNNDNVDWNVALNACYAEVMDHFLINLPRNLRNSIEQTEENLSSELTSSLSREVIEDSRSWGRSVARQVIDFARSDEEAERQIRDPQPQSYEPPVGEGYWTYSAEQERALFPYWQSVRTFIISPDETTTIPPIPYSEDPSSEYFQQMMEVYTVNNTAREEDNEQLWIAEFWSDDVTGITFSPPSRQISISNQLMKYYNLNLEEALHLNLKLGFALNDAAVSTWKYKYEHMVMRPNVFIHEFIDPDFQTNLYRLIPWPNPTFPGYPSGHSAFASAAAGVFQGFFGDQTDITDISHEGRTEFRGMPRRFTSFNTMAEENGYSRIPLGVHVKMDCTEGLRLGYEISNAVNSYDVRRLEG